MIEPEITTGQQLLPYILSAITIVLSASAYYLRDALRERSRVIKQKNDLDVAKQELTLKLNEQEIAYKRELQETITRLNERMETIQSQHQASLDEEINARRDLETRLSEIEQQHQEELDALKAENLRLSDDNRRLTQEMRELKARLKAD